MSTGRRFSHPNALLSILRFFGLGLVKPFLAFLVECLNAVVQVNKEPNSL